MDVPLVLVAHDLSPADMMQFKQSVFAGFVTDVGGKTSHTAIVARSMDIPAVVGARGASQLVRQDDWIIIDGDAGVVIVDPSPIILAEYGFKQRQGELERDPPEPPAHTPAVTLDGEKVELLANIELPEDASARCQGRRCGRGPVPQRIPVHGPPGQPAGEEEQYQAYWRAVRGHAGPARDHPHGGCGGRQAAGRQPSAERSPEPGTGLARHSLEPGRPGHVPHAVARDPARSGARARCNMLIPMLAHASEIRQHWPGGLCARRSWMQQGQAYGPVKAGRHDRGAGGGA
jgi:phosphotransferase system enzyme I (PtsI)